MESEAVRRARRLARRPLNSFEERRVRRQARSEFAGGANLQLGQQDDWPKPLKPEVKEQLAPWHERSKRAMGIAMKC